MRSERPKSFRLTTTPVHHCLFWCAGLTHYLRSFLIFDVGDLDLEDFKTIRLRLSPSPGLGLSPSPWDNRTGLEGRMLPPRARSTLSYRHGTFPISPTRLPYGDAFRRLNASTTT